MLSCGMNEQTNKQIIEDRATSTRPLKRKVGNTLESVLHVLTFFVQCNGGGEP